MLINVIRKERNMRRTDLNRRIAALAGAAAVASAAGMLVPGTAQAEPGEITVTTPENEKTTYTLKNGSLPCTKAESFGYGEEEITIVNETKKKVEYYNGSDDCTGDKATVAPGKTARFYPEGNYELSFLVPPGN
ncbi:hypothetical protein [Nocardia sp. NPDC052316]|uniref:hypothetical protein n=1 Tax=Nocardia sp. NPDC052316 TaxID=3364329 RepID=UPI0037CAA533